MEHQERSSDAQTDESIEDVVFEILVGSSAKVWPKACEGVKPVLRAVQELLESADQGKRLGFMASKTSLEEAVNEWQESLWGPK